MRLDMTSRISAKMIRLYCDCELTPQQAAQLQECLEADAAQRQEVADAVEAERRLRGCIERVLKSTCPCAPRALGDRIKDALAADDNPSHREFQDRAVVGRIGKRFSRPNIVAIAATLALIAGAVLWGIFGQPIGSTSNPPVDLVAGAAAFADQEHGDCSNRVYDGAPTPAQAEAELAQWLAAPVQVFDLSAVGYEFAGAGRCAMPVPANSAHLTYVKAGSTGPQKPMVSIFIVPISSKCGRLCKDLQPGHWCGRASEQARCMHKVLRSTDGKLVYFLVCCDENDLDAIKQRITLASRP